MVEHAQVPPHETAGDAVAEQGFVLLDGPDGVAVAMTPEAASVTGERLIAAAKLARRQKRADEES